MEDHGPGARSTGRQSRCSRRKDSPPTGIRELGAEAGINSATLYHYVGSKESLLASIIRSCLDELTQSGERAMRRSADPVVQLAGLVSSHVRALPPSTN